MRKLLYVAVLLALWQSAYSQATATDSSYFKVVLVQGAVELPRDGDVIRLKKGPFSFKIWYRNEVEDGYSYGLDYSASLGTYFYDFPDTSDIYDCVIPADQYWTKEAMAEAGCRFAGNKNSNVTMFNSSRLLKLAGPDVFSTWEVRWDKCFHTMDPDIWVENEQVWAQFSVDSILNFYSIKRKERPYIQGFSKMDRDLYVVIAKKNQRGEVQRDKFILRFEGELEQRPAKSLSLKAFKDSIRHQVVDTFLAATLSHDRKAIMELMSKEYVEKRHDQALGGNTIQFIDEFYGVSLEEITGIKRTSLHTDHKGDEMTFEVSVGSKTKACILYLKQCFDKYGRIDFRFFRRGDG